MSECTKRCRYHGSSWWNLYMSCGVLWVALEKGLGFWEGLWWFFFWEWYVGYHIGAWLLEHA